MEFKSPSFNDVNSSIDLGSPTFSKTSDLINSYNQNINSNPNSDINLNFGEKIYNTITSEAEILDLRNVILNKTFKGICWCISTKSLPNRFNRERFDRLYTLIDKNGTLFTTKLYSISDKPTDNFIENSPVYIEGIAHIPYEDIVYRVDVIKVFENLPLHITHFIKSIPNLEEETLLFRNHLTSFKDSSLNVFVNELENLIDITKKFQESAYKPYKINQLGSKILIFNTVIKSVLSKNILYYKIEENIDFIKLLTLLYLIRIQFENEDEVVANKNISYILNLLSNIKSDYIIECVKVLTDGKTENEFTNLVKSEIYIIDNLLRI